MSKDMTKIKKEKPSKKILVIDDDLTLVKMLENRLQANNYEVLTSTDAAQGLELAIKKIPDLIILDVMMPIINGYNLCRLLKTERGYKNIPIIMLTSRSQEEDRKIGREVGADVYIVKPFKMEALLADIRSLLKG